MRFDERFLDDIKSRLRLSDVIGRTVKLRRQGREYVGLSPFTKEKSPSFFVNDDKGFYHDFSSGKHGDLIDFLQETERLTFVEAVERLAGHAGVPMPVADPAAAAQDRRRQSLGDWLELAAKWYEGELRRPGGRAARDYLIGRGLPESEWARFRIGFAPAGRTALKDYALTKGAHAAELTEAGLLIAPEDGGEAYDRFRDRILFPIADGRGRVISFGGRALDPQARAKYLNGPDTPLFDKGRALFGLHEARRLLLAGGAEAALVVVEGYLDVIACQRAQIAAVAAMGTALTEAQMEMLWRLHPEPTLCFDGDAAGMRAAARAIDRALPHLRSGRSFQFALVSGGKDPDDILREQGPAVLREQLGQTTPFVDALFIRERDASPFDTPERLAGLKQRLRLAAKAIADPDVALAYRDALFSRFDRLSTAERPAWDRSRPLPRRYDRRGALAPAPPAPPTPQLLAAQSGRAGRLDPRSAALARYAITDPEVLEDHWETLEVGGFGHGALDALARELVRLRLEAPGLDMDGQRRHLENCGFSALLNDIDQAAAQAGAPFMKSDVTLAAARSQWSIAFEAVHRLASLEQALASAKLDVADAVDLLALKALKADRDRLRRALKTGTIWTDHKPT